MGGLVTTKKYIGIGGQTRSHLQNLPQGNVLFVGAQKLAQHTAGFLLYRGKMSLRNGHAHGCTVYALRDRPTCPITLSIKTRGITFANNVAVLTDHYRLSGSVGKHIVHQRAHFFCRDAHTFRGRAAETPMLCRRTKTYGLKFFTVSSIAAKTATATATAANQRYKSQAQQPPSPNVTPFHAGLQELAAAHNSDLAVG